MAVITRTIQPGEKNNNVTEIQKALISLGANIASGELFTAATAGTYGVTTQKAVAGLLSRFGFQQPFDDDGNPIPWVFEAWVGRLLNIAVGAELGNSAGLQKSVRESFDARQIAPAAAQLELAWLALYAVIARDFTTARKIAAQIPDAPVIKEKVGPIVNLNTLQPPAPELLNPENSYTVLYDYVSRNTIKLLVRGG